MPTTVRPQSLPSFFPRPFFAVVFILTPQPLFSFWGIVWVHESKVAIGLATHPVPLNPRSLHLGLILKRGESESERSREKASSTSFGCCCSIRLLFPFEKCSPLFSDRSFLPTPASYESSFEREKEARKRREKPRREKRKAKDAFRMIGFPTSKRCLLFIDEDEPEEEER